MSVVALTADVQTSTVETANLDQANVTIRNLSDEQKQTNHNHLIEFQRLHLMCRQILEKCNDVFAAKKKRQKKKKTYEKYIDKIKSIEETIPSSTTFYSKDTIKDITTVFDVFGFITLTRQEEDDIKEEFHGFITKFNEANFEWTILSEKLKESLRKANEQKQAVTAEIEKRRTNAKDALATKKEEIKTELKNKFGGFYFHGNGGKPMHAIICNQYADRLNTSLTSSALNIDLTPLDQTTQAYGYDASYHNMHQLITHGRYNSRQADAITLRWQNNHTTIGAPNRPLHLPITVRVLGPSPHSIPTICYVAQWVRKSALYCMIETRVVASIVTALQELHAIKDDVADPLPLSLHGISCKYESNGGKLSMSSWVTLENVLNAYHHMVTNVLSGQATSAPSTLGCSLARLMLATSILHSMDMDGGTRFRDKRGRDAAFFECRQALRSVLLA